MSEAQTPVGPGPVTHISTLWAWLFVALLAIAMVIGTVGRVFSAAVVLDLVSFWPFLVVIFLVAAAVLPRSRGRWLGSVVPLLLIGWLVTAIVLHLNGWDQLPSSAARLYGPVHLGTAELTIDVPGLIDLVGVSGQSESYVVNPRRAGGEVGAPEAIERQEESSLTVGIRPTATSQWFLSEGWDISLDERIGWALDVTAGQTLLDLSRLAISTVRVDGDGSVVLPPPGENLVELELTGNVTVVVTSDSIVHVIGDGTVPTGWVPTDDGYRSDEGDPTLVVTVIAGTVVIEDNP